MHLRGDVAENFGCDELISSALALQLALATK